MMPMAKAQARCASGNQKDSQKREVEPRARRTAGRDRRSCSPLSCRQPLLAGQRDLQAGLGIFAQLVAQRADRDAEDICRMGASCRGNARAYPGMRSRSTSATVRPTRPRALRPLPTLSPPSSPAPADRWTQFPHRRRMPSGKPDGFRRNLWPCRQQLPRDGSYSPVRARCHARDDLTAAARSPTKSSDRARRSVHACCAASGALRA